MATAETQLYDDSQPLYYADDSQPVHAGSQPSFSEVIGSINLEAANQQFEDSHPGFASASDAATLGTVPAQSVAVSLVATPQSQWKGPGVAR